jgi:hypothetical protein
MRLWSLHPRYLDPQGLVALWREGLLAQKVLRGLTKGYKHHPQLERFRSSQDPVGSIGGYLSEVYREALKRGYRFDKTRIHRFSSRARQSLPVTQGQVRYEKAHLVAKLKKRAPIFLKSLGAFHKVEAHPLFRVRPGKVESWEKLQEKKRALTQGKLGRQK